MGEVVDLDKGISLIAHDPKEVLRKIAKTQNLAYVLVLGWTPDDEFFVATSSPDLMAANYIANRLITWIHVDGGAHEAEEE